MSGPTSAITEGDVSAASGPIRSSVLAQGCDRYAASAVVASVFAPHQLHLCRAREQLRFELRVGRVGATTMAYTAFGTPVRITTDGMVGKLAIHITRAGHVSMTRGSESFPCDGDRAWVADGEQHRIHLSGESELVSLIIRSDAVEDHLRRLLGQDLRRRLVFAPSAATGRDLDPTFALMARAIEREAGQHVVPPLLAAHLDELVLTTLLLSHPHSFTDDLLREGTPGSPRIVRRVERAIHDRPEHPWTMAELADEAGASIRTVQAAFRDHRGCSPFALLRMVRLERAHRELLDPRPEATVTSIATRWGFTNMGRFAAAYRRRYQQAPAETLRHMA